MGHNLLRSGLLVFAAVVFLSHGTGCNGSNSPLVPSSMETRTVTNGSNITYATSGVQVVAGADTFLPGDAVDLGVILNPANLPNTGRNPAIHTKMASVDLEDVTNSGTDFQSALVVKIPLLDNGSLNNNTTIRLFRFDRVLGVWASTGRNATIDDVTRSATFTIDDYGTYGVFRYVPLSVSIAPSRTTGNAPFSVTLSANIQGGTPPYTTLWYFGDDSDPDIGQIVSHIYKDPVDYHASVTILDSSSPQETATNIVRLTVH